VRVLLQVLAPGVEHGDKADLGAEMTPVGGDRAQRLGRRLEQDGVDRGLVLEGNFGRRAFVLSTATGKTEIVDNLAHLWMAAERLLGRPCDPLDEELIALMERELG
jgi:hypothetical protein